MLRRSANKARKGGSMLIRFLESTFFLKICKRARAVRENAAGRVQPVILTYCGARKNLRAALGVGKGRIRRITSLQWLRQMRQAKNQSSSILSSAESWPELERSST